ncbi:MAG: hypothetical protein AAFN48_00645, partial [Pseudomonadota bacterium]
MKSHFSSFFNSISARVMALLAGVAIIVVLIILTLMQTPIATSVFSRVLSDNASSIAELTTRIEEAPPELEEFILTAYSGEWRVARIEADFEPELKPDPQRAQLIDNQSSAPTALAHRDIRFRTHAAWEMT